MSIKRTNWSALSSLARQRTVEDEEEVQRERRRRVKSSTSSADPDEGSSTTGRDTSSGGNASGNNNTREESHSMSSEEQMQQDFVEVLKVRDEKRRMRHVEMLRRQKEVESDADPRTGGGRGEAKVEQRVELDEEQDSVFKTQPTLKPASFSSTDPSSTSRMINTDKHDENSKLLSKDPHPKAPSHPGRKFVSSVSISLDKSPSMSGQTTPLSPCSPQENWPSPCHSPSPRGAQSPVQNGHVGEKTMNGVSAKETIEPSAKPAFVRHSSRTVSFRLMKRKEEDTSPLQRSCSVKMASKKFEPKTEQTEDNTSSFQRNSRHRTSSRSIQEKMEKLAQAAQRAEMSRSPEVAHRTMLLQDEVSRKRGIFEKDQTPQSPPSPVTAQEPKSFTSGLSERINRWRSKSSHSPSGLKHVDINSKRSLFENREDSISKSSSGNMFK